MRSSVFFGTSNRMRNAEKTDSGRTPWTPSATLLRETSTGRSRRTRSPISTVAAGLGGRPRFEREETSAAIEEQPERGAAVNPYLHDQPQHAAWRRHERAQ